MLGELEIPKVSILDKEEPKLSKIEVEEIVSKMLEKPPCEVPRYQTWENHEGVDTFDQDWVLESDIDHVLTYHLEGEPCWSQRIKNLALHHPMITILILYFTCMSFDTFIHLIPSLLMIALLSKKYLKE